MRAKSTAIGLSLLIAAVQPGFGWEVDGHKTVALLTKQCVTKGVRQNATAILAADNQVIPAENRQLVLIFFLEITTYQALLKKDQPIPTLVQQAKEVVTPIRGG